MSDKIKETLKKIPIKKVVPIVGIILVVVLAVVLLWQGSANSNQSISATPAKVYFVGEYIMSNGERGPIEDGKHISSTQGDVTLRGNFHYSSPGGEYIGVYKGNAPIAFYTDHIHLIFRQAGLTYAADHVVVIKISNKQSKKPPYARWFFCWDWVLKSVFERAKWDALNIKKRPIFRPFFDFGERFFSGIFGLIGLGNAPKEQLLQSKKALILLLTIEGVLTSKSSFWWVRTPV